MKLLLYCTKAKPYLRKYFDNEDDFNNKKHTIDITNKIDDLTVVSSLNGKIVAECDYEVEEICSEKIDVGVGYEPIFYTERIDDISKKSCLTQFEIENYLGCKAGGEVVGYAIHIKNLHIFNEPKELNGYSDYFLCDKDGTNRWEQIRKAPQNMCRVFDIANKKYILISIKPEWLCKILNGEKTVEIRKKVLKEMLNNE